MLYVRSLAEWSFFILQKSEVADITKWTEQQVKRLSELANEGLTNIEIAPMLFATEFSDIWSNATTREIITGHFHTQQTNVYQGVIHRQLGTIKPNDNYEIENGWTMGKKVLQLFEYDSERLRVTYDI